MIRTLFPNKAENLPRVVGFRFECTTIHGRRFEAEVVRIGWASPEVRDAQNNCVVPLGEIKGWRHVAP